MFYTLRDEIGNKVAQWIMKHIHCYTSTFYACCSRYYPADVKCMTESFLTAKGEKDFVIDSEDYKLGRFAVRLGEPFDYNKPLAWRVGYREEIINSLSDE